MKSKTMTCLLMCSGKYFWNCSVATHFLLPIPVVDSTAQHYVLNKEMTYYYST